MTFDSSESTKSIRPAAKYSSLSAALFGAGPTDAASSAISSMADGSPLRLAARNAPPIAPTPTPFAGSRVVSARPAHARPNGSKSTSVPGASMPHALSAPIKLARWAPAESRSILPAAIASRQSAIAASASARVRAVPSWRPLIAASSTRVGAAVRNCAIAKSASSPLPPSSALPPAAAKYRSASAASRGEPAVRAAIPNFAAIGAVSPPVAVHAMR